MSDKRQALLCQYYWQAIKLGVPIGLCDRVLKIWVRGVRSYYDKNLLDRFDQAILGAMQCQND